MSYIGKTNQSIDVVKCAYRKLDPVFFEDPFCRKLDAVSGKGEVQSPHNRIVDNLPPACDLLEKACSLHRPLEIWGCVLFKILIWYFNTK